MFRKNSARFAECFPNGTSYETLKVALIQSDQAAQLAWAKEIIRTNKTGWKQAFRALGDVQDFQGIQLREAANFNSNVQTCIREMRRLSSSLMEVVYGITYIALYDLCIQQGGLDKGDSLSNIKKRVIAENPLTQEQLLRICVQERAKTASKLWMADCMSRRMGIIEGSSYSVTLSGHTANRTNENFHLLEDARMKHVCDL